MCECVTKLFEVVFQLQPQTNLEILEEERSVKEILSKVTAPSKRNLKVKIRAIARFCRILSLRREN